MNALGELLRDKTEVEMLRERISNLESAVCLAYGALAAFIECDGAVNREGARSLLRRLEPVVPLQIVIPAQGKEKG